MNSIKNRTSIALFALCAPALAFAQGGPGVEEEHDDLPGNTGPGWIYEFGGHWYYEDCFPNGPEDFCTRGWVWEGPNSGYCQHNRSYCDRTAGGDDDNNNGLLDSHEVDVVYNDDGEVVWTR